MDTLFNMDALKDSEHAGTGKTCGKCAHAIRPHYYRRDWLYCEVTASYRTQFGLIKVRSRLPACKLFERKEK